MIAAEDEDRGQIVEAHVVLAAGNDGRCAHDKAFAGSCEEDDRALQVSKTDRLHRRCRKPRQERSSAFAFARPT